VGASEKQFNRKVPMSDLKNPALKKKGGGRKKKGKKRCSVEPAWGFISVSAFPSSVCRTEAGSKKKKKKKKKGGGREKSLCPSQLSTMIAQYDADNDDLN